MNRTTTRVQLWRIDCEAFRQIGSSFELRDVTTEAHEEFVRLFVSDNSLNFAREGSTVTFFPLSIRPAQ